VSAAEGWRAIVDSRYLGLIAVILLLAQLAQPLIDYQFIKSVETAFTDTDARTAYLSTFFSVLGLVAIAINLIITPLVHRYLGVMAGLLAQPIAITVSSLLFSAQPVLMMAAVMKIGDRGLSYSINRASKELLYVPVDPVQTYQAKAWIDMFGYRVFKVMGSVVILALTQWSSVPASLGELSIYVVACCLTWVVAVALLSREYRTLTAVPAAA
jgi:AAA family ATP:ADP antiporter